MKYFAITNMVLLFLGAILKLVRLMISKYPLEIKLTQLNDGVSIITYTAMAFWGMWVIFR